MSWPSLHPEPWRLRASSDSGCLLPHHDRPGAAEECASDTSDRRPWLRPSSPTVPLSGQTPLEPGHAWQPAAPRVSEDSWHPQPNVVLLPTEPAVHNPRTGHPSFVAI